MKQSSIRRCLRSKYDITNFRFVSMHDCSEWKWKKCSGCISKTKCRNHVRQVYPSEQGIYFPVERIEIAPKCSEDLGFYIHEFTEATIIRICRRFSVDWHKSIHFSGYKRTYIAHFISKFGTNNNMCLEPTTKRNKPKW